MRTMGWVLRSPRAARAAAIFAVFWLAAAPAFSPGDAWAQGRDRRQLDDFTAPDEILSLGRDMPINEALVILNGFSQKFAGKPIVDLEGLDKAIGIDINNMSWFRAAESIARANRLELVETNTAFLLRKPSAGGAAKGEEEEITLDTREVIISAVFFEGDRQKLREIGINWTADWAKGAATRKVEQLGGNLVPDPVFTTDVFEPAVVSNVDVSAVLNALQSSQVGEVIATPRVTVISGEEGRIQVGEDFSIKTRDIAGNVIDTFFSVGTILTVKPKVIHTEGQTFIHMELSSERSSASPGVVSTVIKKAAARTSVLLLDGEETLIGGLYSSEDKLTRRGVPWLKDLPWWVLGIRYLAGYDRVDYIKKELLILLKAELVPTLTERVDTGANRQSGTLDRARDAMELEIQGRRRPLSDKME